MAYGQSGVPWPVWPVAVLIALLAQWSIVLFNDYADAETDALHRRLFPETLDTRVAVDGLWPRRRLLVAASATAAALVATGWALRYWERGDTLWLVAAGLGLVWAYSFWPFKLNYRGGGEALEAVGVGLLLPLIGYCLATGESAGFAWASAAPLLMLALAGALASGLKHAPADARTGKRTLAVIAGVRPVQKLMLVLLGAASAWVLVRFAYGSCHIAAFMGAGLALRYAFAAYRVIGDLSAFKNQSHRAARLLLAGLIVDWLAG